MKFLFDAVSSAVSCLSAFKDVFSKKLLSRGLRCGPGTEANDLVLVEIQDQNPYEIQPLFAGSRVAGTGSERLGGCHCACELLFLKHQAAL